MFPYPFWKQYLEVFDRVEVFARVKEVIKRPEHYHQANGTGVFFTKVPFYVGPLQYALRYQEIRRVSRRVVFDGEAVIMRVPSPIGCMMMPFLRQTAHPYGIEVVGDPYEVFSPGAVRSRLRCFFRWWFSRQLSGQCASASAASYVTEKCLQRRYPPGQETWHISFSDVDLPYDAHVPVARSQRQFSGPFTLVTVGSMEQMYKGYDVLIKAVRRCIDDGIDLELAMVGEGKYRPMLEDQVQNLGLVNRVVFKGQLQQGGSVYRELDRGDLFVLPSRTEGLPRAMIEAMARALPCIGSMVGGIPELLPSDDMVPPGDDEALARKIKEILRDPARMEAMSQRNLLVAKKYSAELMHQKRHDFLKAVEGRTRNWLMQKKFHHGLPAVQLSQECHCKD